ncbi:MAG TPA: TlpA disulfide reductase family protein [Candidatus Limnocylindrales bacterium]
MTVLIAAVAFAGLLGLANLMFAFGLIRRLREHTEILDRLSQSCSGERVVPILGAGDAVAEFDTTTIDGERVSRDDLAGITVVVGVFSPGCPACEDQLGDFVSYARTHPGGRRVALAVVVGTEAESRSYVERLDAVARVVREPMDGTVSKALAVRGFPAFALIADGRVRVSGFTVGDLPATVAG